jgi:hypothetical protein
MIIKVHNRGSQKTLKRQITAQKTMGSLLIPVMHVAKGVNMA